MGRVVVDGLDLRERVEVVLLRIYRLRGWIRGGVSNPHAVLDEPFVDGLRRVRHEDPAPEICLGQHVGKRGRVVDVEAWGMLVKVISAACTARSQAKFTCIPRRLYETQAGTEA